MREYRQWFESLAELLTEISEGLLEGKFVNGLKSDVQAKIRVLRPNGLEELMDMAQRIDEKKSVGPKAREGNGPVRNKSRTHFAQN